MIDLLKTGDEMQVKEVYVRFRSDFIAFIVSYFRCVPDRASEIYPESFSKLYFNLRDGKLVTPLRCALKTYLYAVGRRIYQKRYYSTYQSKITLPESMPDLEEASASLDYYEYEAQAALVKRLLKQIDEKCRNLLNMLFIEERDAREVCRILQIDKLGTLRKRKFDCMQKLRAILKKDSEYQEYL